MAACQTEKEAIFAVAGLAPEAERPGWVALRTKIKGLPLLTVR
nr:hypothetical protein [Methylobacterium sp. L1A1]